MPAKAGTSRLFLDSRQKHVGMILWIMEALLCGAVLSYGRGAEVSGPCRYLVIVNGCLSAFSEGPLSPNILETGENPATVLSLNTPAALEPNDYPRRLEGNWSAVAYPPNPRIGVVLAKPCVYLHYKCVRSAWRRLEATTGTRIRRWGNSRTLRIPKSFAVEEGLYADAVARGLAFPGNRFAPKINGIAFA